MTADSKQPNKMDATLPDLGRPLYRISVAQYHRMIDHGILTKYDPVELIHGILIRRPKKSPGHASCRTRLANLRCLSQDDRFIVGVVNAIVLADSEPEPDFALYRFQDDFYTSGKPRPKDTFLVVEVADDSVEFQRDVKGSLYASNGICEYWVVDLTTDTVHVHRNPRPDGTWADVTTQHRGDTLTIAALPGVSVAVADILT
jgi:Uma2 family endonuclease